MELRIQERMDLFTYGTVIEFNLIHLTFDSDVSFLNKNNQYYFFL